MQKSVRKSSKPSHQIPEKENSESFSDKPKSTVKSEKTNLEKLQKMIHSENQKTEKP